MHLQPRNRRQRILLGLMIAAGFAGAALAGTDNPATGISLLPRYQQECASCHAPFPPGMLPAASWQRVMANLPHHYGTDASLDPASEKELAAWIGANAGTYRRVSEQPPQERITRSVWFNRKHDEVAAATWKLPAVKSPANCAACHQQADKGDFNERNVRIPR